MKVGTDGVLLGAWTSLEHAPDSVLDVGSGTGVISLMIAQRTKDTQIDAIEINEKACQECIQNFENSSWNDRLFCYHASFEDFVQEMMGEQTYDLIISNPPFYTTNYKTTDENKNKARFEDALPFSELLQGVSGLLSEKGVFSVIIPHSEEKIFIDLANKHQLFPQKITHVKGTPNSSIKRSLIAFSQYQKNSCITDTLIIEVARHQYTNQYTELIKDFYL